MITVAVPAFRVSCRVAIEKGRPWSIIDELVLWATTRAPRTVAELSTESALPHQLIIASLARLMRFRLVEVSLGEGRAAFRSSDLGAKIVTSGEMLPFFGKRHTRRVTLVVERVSGCVLPARQVDFQSSRRVEKMLARRTDVRVVAVEGGEPAMSHHANFARLAEFAVRGPDERLVSVDDKTASAARGYILINIAEGDDVGIPRAASGPLREAIRMAAGARGETKEYSVEYTGPKEPSTLVPTYVECSLDADDVLLGGSVHRTAFESLLASACRRAIIHSTFLQASRADELFDIIRAACRRGVVVDVLWGAEQGDDSEQKNALAALEIAKRIREDSDTEGRVHVRLTSTGSHAKILLVDNADGGWISVVGSCNWLSTPFRAAELSVVLRSPAAVSQVVDVVQRMVGRRGLCEELATELAVVAEDLRQLPSFGGRARVGVVVGDAHDALMRAASGSAERRLVIGSNRLGATARSGALIPGEVAAARPGVGVALLYRSPTGPLRRPDARALTAEAADRDVRIIHTEPVPLHGKFVAWDDDDVVITSLNWASAAVNPDFPYGEVGVHVHAVGIARDLVERLTGIYPELAESAVATGAQ